MKKRSDATPIEGVKQEDQSGRGSTRPVAVYVAALIVVVLMCIVLSYFIQQRNDSKIDTLSQQNMTAQQKIENLQELNIELQTENSKVKAENEDVNKQLVELKKELEDVRLQWADDVKSVESNYKAEYNALLQKYNELLKSTENNGSGE